MMENVDNFTFTIILGVVFLVIQELTVIKAVNVY